MILLCVQAECSSKHTIYPHSHYLHICTTLSQACRTLTYVLGHCSHIIYFRHICFTTLITTSIGCVQREPIRAFLDIAPTRSTFSTFVCSFDYWCPSTLFRSYLTQFTTIAKIQIVQHHHHPNPTTRKLIIHDSTSIGHKPNQFFRIYSSDHIKSNIFQTNLHFQQSELTST